MQLNSDSPAETQDDDEDDDDGAACGGGGGGGGGVGGAISLPGIRSATRPLPGLS